MKAEEIEQRVLVSYGDPAHRSETKHMLAQGWHIVALSTSQRGPGPKGLVLHTVYERRIADRPVEKEHVPVVRMPKNPDMRFMTSE